MKSGPVEDFTTTRPSARMSRRFPMIRGGLFSRSSSCFNRRISFWRRASSVSAYRFSPSTRRAASRSLSLRSSSEAIRTDIFSENSRIWSSSMRLPGGWAVIRRLYTRHFLFSLCGPVCLICELCGADVPRLKSFAIEETILSVCGECARFGEEVSSPVLHPSTMPPVIAQRLEARQRRMTPKDVYAQGGELELLEDFPQRIRTARESRGWTHADLGAKINERVSVIAKLESGTITPGDDLVRKLERELGVKLKERVAPVSVKKATPGAGLTLGDLLKAREGRE